MASAYFVVVADNFGERYTYKARVSRPHSERGAIRIRRNAFKAAGRAGLRGGLFWVAEYALHNPVALAV